MVVVVVFVIWQPISNHPGEWGELTVLPEPLAEAEGKKGMSRRIDKG